MLPREDDELLDARAGRGRRGAAGPDARGRAATARRPSTCASSWPAEDGRPLPQRAAAALRCAASARRRPEAVYAPERLGAALGGLLRTPPRVDLAHLACRACQRGRAPPTCARCCAAALVDFDEAVARRRPRDRRGHPVRAAGALQAGRGDVDPGRARSARSRSSRAPGPRPRARRRRQLSELAGPSRRCSSSRPSRCRSTDLARRASARRGRLEAALAELGEAYAPGDARAACCARSRAAGRSRPTRCRGRGAPPAGQAAHPAAVARAGRDARDRRLPAAGLAARDRAHPRRQRRLGDGDAARARPHRGVGPLAVRRRPLPHDAALPEALRPPSLDDLPDPSEWDPTPEEEATCATACCGRPALGVAPATGWSARRATRRPARHRCGRRQPAEARLTLGAVSPALAAQPWPSPPAARRPRRCPGRA